MPPGYTPLARLLLPHAREVLLTLITETRAPLDVFKGEFC